jgi:MiaB/RimO family radical SAM methylthiotransferase
MKKNKTFHIITLGCRTNQYESRSLKESWLTRGLRETGDPSEADLILVNSCAVTAKAVRDTNRAARRAARDAPGAEIIIAGCAAQVLADKLAASNPGAEIVPQSLKAGLADRPESGEQGPEYPDFSISGYDRARAVCKVQDGCSHGCTFCIVPRTRGRSVSREPGEAVAEVRRLFEAGFAEVCLSGVNLRHYGRDLSPALDFWDLLARIDGELSGEWAGRARLRLSSLDPGQLGPKALDTLAASGLVCPHLHLSLQSLSPNVLAAMNRGHYGPEDVESFLADLSEAWPVFGLGADLLTGFPGETEADFRATLAAVRKLPLTYAHVFPFSRRPGTRAASMPGRTDAAVAKARAAALREAAGEKRSAFLRRLAGLDRVRVALETLSPAAGICEYYARALVDPAPDNARCGGLYDVRPVGANHDALLTEPEARKERAAALRERP